jgi:hypothetical protein
MIDFIFLVYSSRMVNTIRNRKNRKNTRKSRRTRRNSKYGGTVSSRNLTKTNKELYERAELLGNKINAVNVINPAFGANRDKMRNFLGKNVLKQLASPAFNPPISNTGFNKNPQFRNWLVRKGSRPLIPHPPPAKPVETHAFNPMAVTVVNNPLLKIKK